MNPFAADVSQLFEAPQTAAAAKPARDGGSKLFCRQLGVLVLRNYRLKRRSACSTCCELLSPIIVTLFLFIGTFACFVCCRLGHPRLPASAAGWSVSQRSIHNVDAQIYVNQKFDIKPLVGQVRTGFEINTMTDLMASLLNYNGRSLCLRVCSLLPAQG
jgi:hypothetical protein